MPFLPFKPTISARNFTLGSDLEIAFIQPFLYFVFKIFVHNFCEFAAVPPDPQSLTATDPPLNTCGLTPPNKIPARLGQRPPTTGEAQACVSLLFIAAICLASKRFDFKWHHPIATHSSTRSFTPIRSLPLESALIPPLDDYRITQRREAMRLLFMVVISGFLSPIMDYLFGPAEAHGEVHLLGGRHEELSGFLRQLAGVGFAIYVFDRRSESLGALCGMLSLGITLRCLAAATVSAVLAYWTFGLRYGLVNIWDRRIERWEEGLNAEKRKAENDEWKRLRERFDLQSQMEEAQREAKIKERDEELYFWRKGGREGSGFGPDYWLPRVG